MKNWKKVFALLLAALMTLGCLALAEDVPETAEVLEVVETPVVEASEVEPEVEAAPEAEPVNEAAAEEPEIPAEEGEEAPAEVPAEEEPAPEEPETAPEEPVEPEETPAEPEVAPEEEATAEEAPIEEAEAADEGEEIAEEAEFAVPEGLVIENGVVTEYTGTAEKLVIPNGVTGIGADAFLWCISLTSVTIPGSVTSIGEYAFYRCEGLTSISIPNRVTSIGDYAFSGCIRLKSLTIPNSVTSIGDFAFEECTGLTSVSIGSCGSTGDSTFRACTSLTNVSIGSGVTRIGFAAFEECTSLTSVSIPNSVTSIGQTAFYGCSSLTKITIPTSVTSIEVGAFNVCYNLTIQGYAGSYAQAYAQENGIPFKVIVKEAPDVYSAFANVERIPANEAITFTVTTPVEAKYLAMFSENGSKVKTWGKTGNSTESGDTRTWTVYYAVSNPGSRKLTFKCAKTTTYGEGVEVSVRVLTARPVVTSASVSPTTIEKGKTATFTVVTPTSARFVALYSENGIKVKSWGYSSNYTTVSGSTCTWTIPYAISGTGNRTLTFRCCADGYGFYGEGKTVSLKVTAALPVVSSITASATTVNAKTEITFTVKTPSTAKYLAMFSESGSKVKVWTMSGNSTVSGSTRIWTVKYAIANKGSRQLTFKCSANGTYGEGRTISITVQ